MTHNKHNLKAGETVILDNGRITHSVVVIESLTPNALYARIYPVELLGQVTEADKWEVMIYRLSPLSEKCRASLVKTDK